MENWSKIVKEWRMFLQMSQEEFAEKIGATQATVANWEIGKREPSYRSRRRIAKLCKVSVDLLKEMPRFAARKSGEQKVPVAIQPDLYQELFDIATSGKSSLSPEGMVNAAVYHYLAVGKSVRKAINDAYLEAVRQEAENLPPD